MILTGSQLLFFKETLWATALFNDPAGVNPILFKPDESVPLKDAIALYDLTYDKVGISFSWPSIIRC